MKIIKDKKGIEIKEAFFAVIVVGMAVLATGMWINEWNEDYSAGLTYDLEVYNELDTISGEISKQQGNISVRSAGQNEEFEGTSIRAVFGILNNIYAPFRVVFGNNGMLDSITERIGLPDWVRQGLVAIMVVAITMTLIAIFFRLPTRNV